MDWRNFYKIINNNMDKIIFPKEWIKKKGRKNAYGDYSCGEYNWNRRTDRGGTVQVYDKRFIEGYRMAISDIKKLNK
jgi:hypothetical protein